MAKRVQRDSQMPSRHSSVKVAPASNIRESKRTREDGVAHAAEDDDVHLANGSSQRSTGKCLGHSTVLSDQSDTSPLWDRGTAKEEHVDISKDNEIQPLSNNLDLPHELFAEVHHTKRIFDKQRVETAKRYKREEQKEQLFHAPIVSFRKRQEEKRKARERYSSTQDSLTTHEPEVELERRSSTQASLPTHEPEVELERNSSTQASLATHELEVEPDWPLRPYEQFKAINRDFNKSKGQTIFSCYFKTLCQQHSHQFYR
eukprot:gb/GECG01005131.1/.p1 GENE.gb/GECG01005131.1/~~gb/GECG01005131.1/.p1  ORF type:complete len:259 (+),score=30.66 gb/GECG01005131.1/:1-777(+)